jgi:hypothetical protein
MWMSLAAQEPQLESLYQKRKWQQNCCRNKLTGKVYKYLLEEKVSIGRESEQ